MGRSSIIRSSSWLAAGVAALALLANVAACGDDGDGTTTGSGGTTSNGSGGDGQGGTGQGGDAQGGTGQGGDAQGGTGQGGDAQGGGGAGQGGAGQGGAGQGGGQGGAGGASCASCSEVWNGNADANDLCTSGDPSSASLYQDATTCVCNDNCAGSGQCANNFCQDMPASAQCTACMNQFCNAEVVACQSDL